MKDSPKSVVDKMFEAFAKGDVEKFVDTVSSDTIWVYHGTQIIPKTHLKEKKESANSSIPFSVTPTL